MKNGSVLPRLGFIGLGDMGGRMTRNLLKAGYTVLGFDLDPERLDHVVLAGASRAGSIEEVVEQSEIVLTSLPSNEIFIEVAETQLIPHARNGQIFIELGTTIPYEIKRLYEAFKAKGAFLLDVPVSGWITGAESGTLSMWAGGDETIYNQVYPILEVMGDPQKIVYCGSSGMGQVVKGVHQLKSGLVNAALMEAVAFGVRAGASPDLLHQIFGGPGKDANKTLQRVKSGEGELIGVKFRELPYYIKEAQEGGFHLPLTEMLYNFCDSGERVVIDDNRKAPSFWHELMSEEKHV